MTTEMLEHFSEVQVRSNGALPLCWGLPWCQKTLSEHALQGHEMFSVIESDVGTGAWLRWMTMWMWMLTDSSSAMTGTMRSIFSRSEKPPYFETRTEICIIIRRGVKYGIFIHDDGHTVVNSQWVLGGENCIYELILDLLVLEGKISRVEDEDGEPTYQNLNQTPTPASEAGE